MGDSSIIYAGLWTLMTDSAIRNKITHNTRKLRKPHTITTHDQYIHQTQKPREREGHSWTQIVA